MSSLQLGWLVHLPTPFWLWALGYPGALPLQAFTLLGPALRGAGWWLSLQHLSGHSDPHLNCVIARIRGGNLGGWEGQSQVSMGSSSGMVPGTDDQRAGSNLAVALLPAREADLAVSVCKVISLV